MGNIIHSCIYVQMYNVFKQKYINVYKYKWHMQILVYFEWITCTTSRVNIQTI